MQENIDAPMELCGSRQQYYMKVCIVGMAEQMIRLSGKAF